MDKKNKEEIKYISNVLENYYFLRRKEKMLNQEILELDFKIENERISVKGMQYDCNGVSGSGCSVNVPKPYSVNYLTSKQLDLSLELESLQARIKSLDENERITSRLKKLSPESKIIINNYFERQMTLEDIANTDVPKVSKQTISNRLDKALNEMYDLWGV